MLSKAARLWALLLLALALQLAAAQSFNQLWRRQNNPPPFINPRPVPAPAPENTGVRPGSESSSSSAAAASSAPAPVTDVTTTAASSTGGPSATDSPPESSSTTAASSTDDAAAAATATNEPLVNPKFLNATIPAGQLPLPPEITPGWGVSGVIMLLTGVIYTLVGIKNRWIHTFFSTAYITALGVAVLIVYVMTVPVSNAVQGGYVVAVVMSGCAVGAASMFFKELTEGLGCALGGFCVSMWLLCLVPGGLLRTVPSKAIFIACFTLVGFAFYFSRWTRDWALIVTIAFSGATVTVLGIDCFSRAGLKEFWAYIWDVNGNLFPLGADTYPVTKGIRVETAAIIVIFLMGIISQIKLWRIVRDRREKRAVERAEGQRNLELEEENVGRQVEQLNARERRQWERVYGHGTPGSAADSRMTDLGDTGSEKKLRGSNNGSLKRRSSVEVIEMADMSESDQSRCGHNPLMAAEEARDGKVTVRVGVDDVPDTPTDVDMCDELDEKVAAMSDRHPVSTPRKRLSQRTTASKRVSQAQTVTEAPEVVPLPFHVPVMANEAAMSEGDRSSIATFAADDASPGLPPPRQSLAKRLSRGSITLLKSLPQMSGIGADDFAREVGGSSEELVIPKSHRPDNDNESLVATVDGESVSGDDGRSVRSPDARRSIEINADLSNEKEPAEQPDQLSAGPANPDVASLNRTRSSSVAKAGTVATALSGDKVEQQGRGASARASAAGPSSGKPKSTASVSSTRVSLTQDRLPRSLSRVAMSYRTNEWAKHLSYAETPEPDEVHVDEPERPAKADRERSVPVDVTELQKTAEEGTPAPAAILRSESRASNRSYAHSVSRRASRLDGPAAFPPLERESPARNQASPFATPSPAAGIARVTSSTPVRRSSAGLKDRPAAPLAPNAPVTAIPEQRPEARPISVSLSLAGSEAPQRAPPPAVPGVVSYSSPQTLIGQREMFLRSKSQGNLLAGAAEVPFVPPPPASDAASVYSTSMYPAPLSTADPDDIPLSQRKQIMRQSSMMSLPQSNPSFTRLPGLESSDSLPFNSHQPKRMSTLPAQAVREAQLANFRQSVQHDLRSGTPIMSTSGRETPFTPASLLGNREAEVQRNIEMQRNVLMGQKEAEAQRKEMQRREKEYVDRAFDERMRTGDLLEAHREAMRKMQKNARE
ncbi:hypothetical protein CDD83_8237 [Cordyceps sp. RAO-2017]|nr:hypothetical protein CDD83_8237 [Cordyceps sp. RAO-2017]